MMVDLAKCGGEKCNIKHLCYRYTAQSGIFMQVYITPSYKDGECINFFYNGKIKQTKEGGE